jgi:transcriptional regulator with XRE-family HTH domain
VIESDPQAAIELAAASLSHTLTSLVQSACELRGDLSGAALAERLGVTEGRVSQVLSGDGNPRVVTIGRYLRALGYEVEARLRSVEPDAPQPHWRWRGAGVSQPHDLYMGFVKHQGHIAPKVTIVEAGVSPLAEEVLRPQKIGEVVSDGDALRIVNFRVWTQRGAVSS